MMSKRPNAPAIRLRGVRHNNLKNFDLDIPIGKLTVITGLSGSGKSSLAFDTLFAEGQRRYIETFSPYARQFFDRMDKPQVDRIEGIPPAIAIEQRNAVRSTRSTVGTMTEICDYLKVVWPHLARLHCRQCGRLVQAEPPQVVWERARHEFHLADRDCLVTFNLPLSEKLSLDESLALIGRQGYQRLLVRDAVLPLEDAPAALQAPGAKSGPVTHLTVVQDRLRLAPHHRARFVEACEQAYHFGHGRLTLHPLPATNATPNAPGPDRVPEPVSFSRGHHCATCDIEYPEPTPALFSFNHPLGACPACKGFGRIISIDYQLAIPDRSRSLADGAVKPWQTGMSAECQVDLAKACKARRVAMDVPFAELSEADQHWVIEGDPDYDSDDPARSWPRKWYGVKGYFRWLESKTYKMHVRVLLSRYRAYTPCAACGGRRLKPEALLYRVPAPNTPSSLPAQATLPDFYALAIADALAFIDALAARSGARRSNPPNDPLTLALGEVRTRLRYLVDVGLGYLTLDRPTRTLSGGETERVNLTTCLGTRLVNTLFVLDEPSVGLHPRDTARLVSILQQLRDSGNTVVVVEHEAGVIRAADQVVDLGPGQGEKGGTVVFVGSLPALLQDRQSLTGRYLSNRLRVDIPARRSVHHAPVPAAPRRARLAAAPASVPADPLHEAAAPYRAVAPAPSPVPVLRVHKARRHNLKNFTVDIPLQRLVALTGVSGSGKTTLIREVLLPALQARLTAGAATVAKASDRIDDTELTDDPSAPGPAEAAIEGWQSLAAVVLVDQSPLGKTPRSNPVVYVGAFDDVRELFAQTDLARQRGLNASAFSFNSGVGQCERCRGAGFEKIEMQFLSDVFIRCPECQGRRYREHILEVKLRGPIDRPPAAPSPLADTSAAGSSEARRLVQWSIADLLEATIDDALSFLGNFLHLPAGRRALARLQLLQDVGLGYLRLGQPINTLSGGESQRLKLVSHLAESALTRPAQETRPDHASPGLDPRNTRAAVTEWLATKTQRPSRRGLSSSRLQPRPSPPTAGPDESPPAPKGTLFLFDEPTTGLHFEDVRVLLLVFQRMVDAGHSVVVIEHNLDVIKCADWVIDLGPEAGDAGGHLVVAGTPEEVAACDESHTGAFLRDVLGR